MGKIRALLFLLFTTLLQQSAIAAHVTGNVKTYLIHRDANSAGKNNDIIDNALRIKVTGNPLDKIHAEIAYEFLPLFRSHGITQEEAQTKNYRVIDLDRELLSSKDHSTFSQNLDRAFLTFSMPSADLHFGRQAIAFGSARVINPTDVLAPYSFDTLNQEERVGVDALRLVIPLGDLSDLDVGFIGGESLAMKQNAAFLRGRFYAFQTDIVGTVALFKKNVLLGFDLQRSIGQAGSWLEAGYTIADSQTPGTAAHNYFSISTGLDYACNDDLYLFVEYHYNEAGASSSADPVANSFQVAYTEGGSYLLRKHYLIPGMSYTITPLLSWNSQLVTNLADPSSSFVNTWEYNIREDMYLNLGWFQNFGHKGSEFKLYPNQFFASLKAYF